MATWKDLFIKTEVEAVGKQVREQICSFVLLSPLKICSAVSKPKRICNGEGVSEKRSAMIRVKNINATKLVKLKKLEKMTF